MTNRELLQMAFKAMDSVNDFSSGSLYGGVFDYEVKTLRAALAQPEREWVGLTDNEVMVLNRQSYDAQIGLLPLTFYRAIEAKLKEKNGY
jgi:hypothetical protein